MTDRTSKGLKAPKFPSIKSFAEVVIQEHSISNNGESHAASNERERDAAIEIRIGKEREIGDEIIREQTQIMKDDVIYVESEYYLLFTRTLAFKKIDLESEFSEFYLNLNIARWKRVYSILFVLLSLLYAYLIIKNTMDSNTYLNTYSYTQKVNQGTTNLNSTSVAGWFIMSCDPNIICSEYNAYWDASFWVGTILVPYITGLILCYQFKRQVFEASIDLLTSVIAFLQILCGVGIRYYVVENKHNFVHPTILMIAFFAVAFRGARTRFIYTITTISISVIVWLGLNIAALSMVQTNLQDSAGSSYGIGLIAFSLGLTVISVGAYETEYFFRYQFLLMKDLRRNSLKLKNQLNMLAKSYNQQAVRSLDSPLERSIMLLRCVMADPELTSRHLLSLGQVTTLLASSNLLTPDFESTAAETMDNEQQAWLFSEIAARRRNGQKKGNNYRRKVSISQSIAVKTRNRSIKESNVMIEDTREPVQYEGDLTASTSGIATTTDHGSRTSRLIEDRRAIYPPDSDEIAQCLNKYVEYDFNLFDLEKVCGNKTLSLLSIHLFSEAKLFELFNIPVDKFTNCISMIEKGYHAELPYHNSIHAADVLHCIHHLANTFKIKDIWSDIELLAMYFAAIIHDHDHPGLSNNFLVTTSDPKATLYNDKAVLENHHCASAFLVLARPENDFLAHLSKAEYKSIREIVLDLVLATDLTQHFSLLSQFKSKVSNSESFDPIENREDRILLFKIMIKCSDVSNPTKDLSLYKPWCRLIMEEFMSQGDMEKKLNLPVSPYMDRENVNVAGCQIGFIDYVVQPLFGALDTFQPIPTILSKLQKNRDYWGNLRVAGVNNIP